MTLPWSERINAISINPDMATRDDIARMAGDLSHTLMQLYKLRMFISKYDEIRSIVSAENNNL